MQGVGGVLTPGRPLVLSTHCSPSQILSDQLTLSQAVRESGHGPHTALSLVTKHNAAF